MHDGSPHEIIHEMFELVYLTTTAFVMPKALTCMKHLSHANELNPSSASKGMLLAALYIRIAADDELRDLSADT